MEVSGKLYNLTVHTKQEACWFVDSFWTVWKREKSVTLTGVQIQCHQSRRLDAIPNKQSKFLDKLAVCSHSQVSRFVCFRNNAVSLL